MKIKICRKCNKELPADSIHFYISQHNDGGLTHSCKNCYGVSFETQLQFNEDGMTKVCTKCNRTLPCDVIHFHKDKNAIGGRGHVCKECKGGLFKSPSSRTVLDAKEGYKVCNKCRKELPLNKDYFGVRNNNPDLFHGKCMKCCHGHYFRRPVIPLATDDGMKFCRSCMKNKPVSEYNKDNGSKDGLFYQCKSCVREYSEKNKVRDTMRQKEWRLKNKERIAKRDKEYLANRRATDPVFRAVSNLRSRMHRHVSGVNHSDYCEKLIGLSYGEFRLYMESKFKEGMSWGNYGWATWHIDHIRPCASFDLTDIEQQKECFHYTNLQPLWAKDNIKKGAKW